MGGPLGGGGCGPGVQLVGGSSQAGGQLYVLRLAVEGGRLGRSWLDPHPRGGPNPGVCSSHPARLWFFLVQLPVGSSGLISSSSKFF